MEHFIVQTSLVADHLNLVSRKFGCLGLSILGLQWNRNDTKAQQNRKFEANPDFTHVQLFENIPHQHHAQRHDKHENGNAIHSVHHAKVDVCAATLLLSKGEVGQDFLEDHDKQT
jgi:hypothetical protein